MATTPHLKILGTTVQVPDNLWPLLQSCILHTPVNSSGLSITLWSEKGAHHWVLTVVRYFIAYLWSLRYAVNWFIVCSREVCVVRTLYPRVPEGFFSMMQAGEASIRGKDLACMTDPFWSWKTSLQFLMICLSLNSHMLENHIAIIETHTLWALPKGDNGINNDSSR